MFKNYRNRRLSDHANRTQKIPCLRLSAAACILLSCAGLVQAQSTLQAGHSEWWDTVSSRIAASQYEILARGSGFSAPNPGHGLLAQWNEDGLTLETAGAPGLGRVQLRVAGAFRGSVPESIDASSNEVLLSLGECRADMALNAEGRCIRRLEIDHPEFLEWWENLPEGLEQGFEVFSPPGQPDAPEDVEDVAAGPRSPTARSNRSTEPLVIGLDIQGAFVDVASGGESATFEGHQGLTLHYNALKAHDALDQPLTAWLEEWGDGLSLVVDDAEAVYPIYIDPLITAAGWSKSGENVGDEFGWTFASPGDCSRDRIADVMVGAPGYAFNTGKVYVFMGSTTGLSTSAWSWEGEAVDSYFGSAIASAGGQIGSWCYVEVGAWGLSNNQGKIYEFYGGYYGMNNTVLSSEVGTLSSKFGFSIHGYNPYGPPYDAGGNYMYVGQPGYNSNTGRVTGLGFQALGTAPGDEMGSATTSGDFNADGPGDIAVAAPGYSSNRGKVDVYRGLTDGPNYQVDWTASGEVSGDRFGAAMAGVGDINGDGYAELLVGASGNNASTGKVYLYLGSATGLATSPSWTMSGEGAGALLGRSVASAGDFNADGYADVLIGSPGYSSGAGKVYLFFGRPTGLASTADWTAVGDDSTQFGWTVGTPGDVNNDSFADVMVGARQGSSGTGKLYVFNGYGTLPATTPHWTGETNNAGAHLGNSVASAGDVNADGYWDIIATDKNATTSNAHVWYGSSAGLQNTPAWTFSTTQADTEFYGTSAGDVNGDGYDDVLLGQPRFDNSGVDQGRVMLFLGSSTGPASTAGWTVESDQSGSLLGRSVAYAGDVNGDGFADVAVGAPSFDSNLTDAGKVSVYLGSSTGLSTSVHWTGSGDEADASFGYSVNTAGDVNGDGFGDVLIGAPHYPQNGTAAGRVYVHYGSALGMASTPPWKASSSQLNAEFGISVASAGDVNSDGYGDIIVGAPNYSNGQAVEGKAFVFMGSSSGLASTAAWQVESDVAGALFGAAVSSAGDVNGDGYGDVLIGAPQETSTATSAGRAWIFLGSSTGLSTVAAWTYDSNQEAASLGGAVASAGDVNADSFGDILIGAPDYDGGELDEGRLLVFLGNTAAGIVPISSPAQARQAADSKPIAAAGRSNATLSFNVAMLSRSIYGKAFVSAELEVKARGTPFDGKSTVVSSQILTGNSGVEVTAQQTSLAAGTSYHWRIRNVYPWDDGTPTLVGRWHYGGFSGSKLGQHTRTMGPCVGGANKITYWPDQDGDGYGSASASSASACTVPSGYVVNNQDCADTDANINPAGTESCNSKDDDCDSKTDEDLPINTYYLDSDTDSYGRDTNKTTGCKAPSGYASVGGDCNDFNASIHPGATETCNSTDDDCDGSVDDGLTFTPYYYDWDGDGYGQDDTSITTCYTPTGYATLSGDCDDNDWNINPGISEQCNGIDDDCTGVADDGLTFTDYYYDADNDGYGDTTTKENSCMQPVGYITVPGDCDDSDQTINPSATETCNSTDDDCDLLIDDGLLFEIYYLDQDGDEYGTEDVIKSACSQPVGYVLTPGDCDDAVDTTHPDTGETCNGVDDNCANGIDDGLVFLDYYLDNDGDGYGDSSNTLNACEPSPGYVLTSGDCDDTSNAIYPSQEEVCNGIDDDCSNGADDGLAFLDYYTDSDGDGYGDPSTQVNTCQQPPDSVLLSGDCNDSEEAIHPDQVETCNGVDDDCINGEDDGLLFLDYYLDADEDSYGEITVPLNLCLPPSGYVTSTGDCNDADDSVNPGEPEVCNAIDDDCNGQADDTLEFLDYYLDGDGDSYGVISAPINRCLPPSGHVTRTGDCNDADNSVNPGEPEVCNGVDDDCNGQADDTLEFLDYYQDADADSYGVISAPINRCLPPSGHVTRTGDCNDQAAAVNPGEPEVCNAIDDDCNGQADDTLEFLDYYFDGDGDGYGVNSTPRNLCTKPDDFVTAKGDCDDTTAAINPGAPEVCNDIDDNCDSSIDESFDEDGDGFRTCTSAAGPADCNDTDSEIHSGAFEACDGIDNDCNGLTDEGGFPWYVDSDADGQGSLLSGVVVRCIQPPGSSSNDLDCNDLDPTVYVGAIERCNDIDDDCDGILPPEEADSDKDGSSLCEEDCDDSDPTRAPTMAEGTRYNTSLRCANPDGLDNDCDGVVDNDTCVSDDDGDGATELQGDCLDSDAATRPGAPENSTDGIDNNCNGFVDETSAIDSDGDGFPQGADCNDLDPRVFPGNAELPDQIDNDCDGTIDEGTINADEDKDGFTLGEGDCNDLDPNTHPDATELADSVDNDCDGEIDEDTERSDDDDDGFSEIQGDCDDEDASINPSTPDTVDGIDNDCDQVIDDGTNVSDDDHDGYCEGGTTSDGSGGSTEGNNSCVGDALPGDCDDSNRMIHPEAQEIGNSTDDDCDGQVDEDLQSPEANSDLDQDGFTPAQGDCDDHNSAAYPGAIEVVDGIDQNCDGRIDDGTDLFDDDYDGIVESEGDCDDSSSTTYPGAPELVDGLDNNCDGRIDDGTTAVDDDGDGWSEVEGDCNDDSAQALPGGLEGVDGLDNDCDGQIDENTSASDDDHDGFTEDAGDCADAQSTVYPGAPEVQDFQDNDCDGQIDETPYTSDDDWDGYSEAEGDCDDTDPTVFPNGTEEEDGLDNNCNGIADEGTPAGAEDNDLDGFSEDQGDCNDFDANISPAAIDVTDGQDNNCDQRVDENEQIDNDGDGWTEQDGDCNDALADAYPGSIERCDGADGDCDGFVPLNELDQDGDGTSSCAGDCADTEPARNPGASETCNGVDDNCDGVIDERVSIGVYQDADRDGVGDTSKPGVACEVSDGFSSVPGDCDDEDAAVHPGLEDVADDGVDQDCDGRDRVSAGGCSTLPHEQSAPTKGLLLLAALLTTRLRRRRPGDPQSRRTGTSCLLSLVTCLGLLCSVDCSPLSITQSGAQQALDDRDGDLWRTCPADVDLAQVKCDCDDSSPEVNPEAPELCNGIDDNCNQSIDEALQVTTWYPDLDQDSYGDIRSPGINLCSAPPFHIRNNADCNDARVDISPDSIELCDGLDNNCNGQIDETGGPAIPGLTVFYPDKDQDGYGDPSQGLLACKSPLEYVTLGSDCNDADPLVYPGAAEACFSGIDANCDGVMPTSTDSDGDGVPSCVDCDDLDASIHPAYDATETSVGAQKAPEVCDERDNDCNFLVDDIDSRPFFFDSDDDGYGDGNDVRESSECLPGYSEEAGDCNDDDSTVYPGATERCNAKDDDCDSKVDEDIVLRLFYRDRDFDGYGLEGFSQESCSAVEGYVETPGDCDDFNPAAYPGALEACGSYVDANCDGSVRIDSDSDGSIDCEDCDSLNAAVFPGALEVCNGIDDDCNSRIDDAPPSTWYPDRDYDGFGDVAGTPSQVSGCNVPYWSPTHDDCNDTDQAVHPGAKELCNGKDEDCDGALDEDADCP